MTIIAESILNQFVRALKMTRDAIEKVPEERWHDGPEKWFFSLTAYHNVETIQFYFGSDPDTMKWGERAGYTWNKDTNIEDDILPMVNKVLVLEYIEETEKYLTEKLRNISDKELLEKDGFHWFSCILEKLQYALRHTAHHNGELSIVLRNWELPHSKWV